MIRNLAACQNLRDFTQKKSKKDLNTKIESEIVKDVWIQGGPSVFRSRTLMGLGDEMVETIGRYKSKVYAIENLEWVTRTRKEHLRDRPEGDLSEKHQVGSWDTVEGLRILTLEK